MMNTAAESVLETCKLDSTFRGGLDEMTWWNERKLVVENSGLSDKALLGELSFTAELVLKDAKNKYAWSHRQWALEALGKGYADELVFCNKILASKHNIHNRLVWDQRCFAVKKCLELGLMIIRSCEVTFAASHISKNPENENPWRYLRFLCKGEMNALAQNVRLQWALRCVFVEARERRHAVTADTLLKNKWHAVFDSVNKRGCLFALDLVSDLLNHGYEPLKEVEDAIVDLFEEFDEPSLAKRVDSVLRKHRMEVMELSADLTRKIINMPGGMEAASGNFTSLLDHIKNPSKIYVWSENRWVTAETPPATEHSPCSYSQLCGVAGFPHTPALFYPDDPCWIESLKSERAKIDQKKRRDTGQVMDDEGGFPLDYNGKYKDLPESLRTFCWHMTELPGIDFDNHTKALVLREGHKNPAAWQARRLVIHARALDIQNEVKILELLSERSSDNYLYWHQRRWVSEKIGKTAVGNELEYTDNVLSKDANNYHAWSHRQWVLEVLGVGWEVELEYCNKFLENDSSNCFAWNQKYFVALSMQRLQLKLKLCEEVEFATNAIKAEPENEMPWTYLQSLMKLENRCCFGWLEPTCGLVLNAEAKSRVFSRDGVQKKGVVNALKMVLFALLMLQTCSEPEFVRDMDSFRSDLLLSLWPTEGSPEQDILQTLKSIDVTWF